jgi:ubiquinone/menaquinone biosynthesis C-methylase UbiE
MTNCWDKKINLQGEQNHYLNTSYDSKERFISYWHQIYEIISLKPKKVLEIGIGNGFVSKYLRERKLIVLTLDIDERLNPDIVGSVLNIPFSDNTFDVVACYEALEHLPYENFQKALFEIQRVSNSYVILSLPDSSRVYRLYIQIPKVGIFKRLISLPRLKNLIHKFDGEHYWEIGKAGYPLNRIISDIKKTGFEVERTYRVFKFPYHRFFILKKKMEIKEG